MSAVIITRNMNVSKRISPLRLPLNCSKREVSLGNGRGHAGIGVKTLFCATSTYWIFLYLSHLFCSISLPRNPSFSEAEVSNQIMKSRRHFNANQVVGLRFSQRSRRDLVGSSLTVPFLRGLYKRISSTQEQHSQGARFVFLALPLTQATIFKTKRNKNTIYCSSTSFSIDLLADFFFVSLIFSRENNAACDREGVVPIL